MELVRLARGAGALRLAIGEGLVVLRRRALDLELGFSSLGAYALERLGQRPRWADDTRRVAERLATLPDLRAAVRSGELGWSMAELLARYATPETEAELLAEARELTFRALRERLARPAGGDGQGGAADGAAETAPESGVPDDDEEPPLRSLTFTVERDVAWAFEATRTLVAAISGTHSTHDFVEALLAEGLVTLQTLRPDLRMPQEFNDEERAMADGWRAELDAWRREAERDGEARIPEYTDADVDPEDLGDLWAEVDRVELETLAPEALDAHLRGLAQRLAERDLRLGELALDFVAQDGWLRVGCGSIFQYLRERLRISHASFKAHMTLARRAITLPEVAAALEAGVIGFEAARLVSRVAERRTVCAWLERATRRTVKHLRDEVEAVESIARATGERQRGPEPPDDETMAGYIELQRAMLDGRVARALANGGTCADALRGQVSADDPEGQMSADGAEGQMSADGAEGQMSADEVVGQMSADGAEGQMSADGAEGQMSADGAAGQMSADGVVGQMSADGAAGISADGAEGQMSADGAAGMSAGGVVGQMSVDGGDGQMSVEGGDGQMSVDGGDGQMSVDGGDGQMSADSEPRPSARPAPDEELRPGAGRVTLRLMLPDDLVRYWRTVEARFRRSHLGGDFVTFLIQAFWHTWLVEDPNDPSPRVAYEHIYQRDRYRCMSPVCSRNDVTPHHLTFRSRGGGEEAENLSSLCSTCHLDLIHGGRMTAEPPASRVRWTIGRLGRGNGGGEEGAGLITVIGREKVT